MVRGHRRRLPVGPRGAGHEVPGGRRGRRRRRAGALGLAPGAGRAADRDGRRRGDRAARSGPSGSPRTTPTRCAATCSSTRAGARCSSTTANAATASAAPRRACSASPSRTSGVAGHASMPGMGDNALLKMAPAARPLRRPPALLHRHRRAGRLPQRDRRGPGRPAGGARAAARGQPPAGDLLRADDGGHVHAHADHRLGEDQRDPQPGGAEGRLPRARRASASRRCCAGIEEVLGPADGAFEIEFTEKVVGNRSAADSPLMDALSAWVAENDPGAIVVPVVLPGLHRLAPLPGRRSPSAWPTASCPSATSRCSSPLR